MTKKQVYRAQLAAYRQALMDGRVLCFGDTTFKTYLSVEAAIIAEHEAKNAGYPVRRVTWRP